MTTRESLILIHTLRGEHRAALTKLNELTPGEVDNLERACRTVINAIAYTRRQSNSPAEPPRPTEINGVF